MTRAETKAQAKQTVDTYSRLLIGCGVISEIESEEIHGEIHYVFDVYEKFDFPFPVECVGLRELATVLRAMWLSYESASTVY